MSDRLTILQGDALERLRELPSESVQCCVTSPPYWGLRDYGTARWEGGAGDCEHEASERYYTMRGASSASGEAFSAGGEANAERLKKARWRESGACVKCGAVRVDKQLGLERTPEEFVGKMVAVFEEVRRVLRKDGTCWVNLGDSYASQGGHSDTGCNDRRGARNIATRPEHEFRAFRAGGGGLKPKDLVGIPWRVAFALQAAGWWLRSDIIWHKPNPMPESVSDRPTKSHEYLFLLTKSERYYYDAEAIKEQAVCGWNDSECQTGKTAIHQLGRAQKVRESRKRGEFNGKTESIDGRNAFRAITETRNKRTVWTVPTCAYADAHFATFPPDLVKPCILAGSRAGDLVLDPFGGSGTTAMVALELGRRATVIELNPKYVAMIERRCAVTPGLGL